ncbi:MAG: hypothetical protein ACI8X5_003649, partial [Planctomycetota bacterium]
HTRRSSFRFLTWRKVTDAVSSRSQVAYRAT